jgi:dodecin
VEEEAGLRAGLAFSFACFRTQEEADMAGVIIIREMVGTSPRSWSDAARQAVATASRTVRNIRTVEVVKSSAAVENGQITEYRVELKIGFEYEG